MTDLLSKPSTAFRGDRLLLSGSLIDVALAVKNAAEEGPKDTILTFDDATGKVVDFDLRGTRTDIVARLLEPDRQGAGRKQPQPGSAVAVVESRGRGRPKLGVTAREVTLLPRHWDWLAAQPGGASVTLRRLVDEARRNGGAAQARRAAHEAAYRFMAAQAGDLPGFEEASRALFADDRGRFEQMTDGWPGDVRAYAVRLAFERG